MPALCYSKVNYEHALSIASPPIAVGFFISTIVLLYCKWISVLFCVLDPKRNDYLSDFLWTRAHQYEILLNTVENGKDYNDDDTPQIANL